MHFLPDVYVPCDVCHGQRYNRETLEIRYKGKNIHEVLDDDGRAGARVLRAGAGGRAQAADAARRRPRLHHARPDRRPRCPAARRSASSCRSSCPSATPAARCTSSTSRRPGLHFHDIELLLTVLHRLRDHGNTVVVIEHNLDVIKTADWIIDLGPEGGDGGGTHHRRRHAGGRSPQSAASYTGRYLKPVLAPKAAPDDARIERRASTAPRADARRRAICWAREPLHNLRGRDVPLAGDDGAKQDEANSRRYWRGRRQSQRHGKPPSRRVCARRGACFAALLGSSGVLRPSSCVSRSSASRANALHAGYAEAP